MSAEINIIAHFLNRAESMPGKLAIEERNRSLSFGELYEMMSVYGADFEQQGVKKGHKVLILHPACTELFAAVLALLGNGCTVVFVEEWSKLNDITSCCKTVQCDFILTGVKGRMIRLFNSALRRISLLKIPSVSKGSSVRFKPAEVDADTPAIISFSSGTSGASKAVIRTHGILNAQFNALRKYILLTDKGKMCTNFSVVILLNLGLGMSTFLSDGIRMSDLKKCRIDALFNDLRSGSVTHLAFSPYLLRQLAVFCINQKRQLQFKQIITGGSSVFPRYVQEFNQAFECAGINVLYGSSEAEPIASCKADMILSHRSSSGIYVGKIDEFTKCMTGTVSASGFTQAPAFSVGEILVSGDHVVKQYLNSEESFKRNKILIDSVVWHRTGDFGYFNELGELFLTGHPDFATPDMPLLEIEKKLSEISGVDVGTMINDVVYIQSKGIVNEKEIRARFPGLKKIKYLQLPFDRRHNGKIRYRRLEP